MTVKTLRLVVTGWLTLRRRGGRKVTPEETAVGRGRTEISGDGVKKRY